jgi:hypothetical protein
MLKEEVVAYFETLHRYSPRGVVEIHRVSHSEYLVPAPKLKTTGKNLPDRNIIFPYRVILLNDIQIVVVTYEYCGGI